MSQVEDRIVVIGASAGGIASLKALVARLPKDFPGALFVVLHIPPDSVSSLPEILSRAGPLPAVHPRDGEEIESGRIYVAPPDHHLLVEGECVGVKKGPKENRFRPSVDALFRSAAYTRGARVIGVVLSGALDDGASGLWTVKRFGGIAVIQLPEDAAFDSMPLSALNQVAVDYSLAATEIGPLLTRLANSAVPTEPEIAMDERKRLEVEVAIAASGDAFQRGVMQLGELTPFTCPECHGVLVKLTEGEATRFRCHTGHAYTASALLAGVMEAVGEGYYKVMRALEEAAMLLDHMGRHFADVDQPTTAELFFKKAREAKERAGWLHRTSLAHEHVSGDTLRQAAHDK